ncbi:MAG TPA: ABC transporter permease [bacterium]|nr:ABC transporter permease [bacterium]
MANNRIRNLVSIRSLPGLYEMRRGDRTSAMVMLLSWLLPIVMIIYSWQAFLTGWHALVTVPILIVTNFEALTRLWSPEIMEHAVASLAASGWIIGVFYWYHKKRLITQQRTSASPWRLAGQAFRRNGFAMCFLCILMVLVLMAIFAPWYAPYDPNAQQDIVVTKYIKPMHSVTALRLKRNDIVPPRPSAQNFSEYWTATLQSINQQFRQTEEPLLFVDEWHLQGNEVFYTQGIQKKKLDISNLIGTEPIIFLTQRMYWLGSDRFGRDILSRLIYGTRISLAIGMLAMVMAVALGTLVGTIAGYFGHRIDGIMMRGVDIMMAFPNLFLILMIVALFGNSVLLMIAVLGLTGWMGVSRIVRSQVLVLRNSEFITAARALGYSHARIMRVHIIPNTLAPVVVAATLRLGAIILVEAGLSFLGVGVQPPTASWGNMVSDGRDALLHAWWISTFPGLAIVLTVMSFNIVGDGVRDALDPKLRA